MYGLFGSRFCVDPLLICGLPFAADSNGMMGSMMQDLAFAIPGVDEAMSFAEIMKSVFPPMNTWLLIVRP